MSDVSQGAIPGGAKPVPAEQFIAMAERRSRFRTALPTFDLQGWDIAHLISYEKFNELARASQPREPLSHRFTSDGTTTTIEGTFGPWTLDKTGGGQSIIRLQLEIQSFDMVITSVANPAPDPVRVHGDSSTLLVELTANFVTQGEDGKFVLRPATGAKSAVEVLVDQPGLKLDDPLKVLDFNVAMQDWCNRNIDQFGKALAAIQVGGSSGASRTKMSAVGFAVSVPMATQPNEDGTLAVLGLLDGATDTGGLDYQIGGNYIPKGADVAVVLSRYQYLKRYLFPALPKLFGPGSTAALPEGAQKIAELTDWAAAFAIDDDESRIQNTVDIQLGELTLTNGAKVNPRLKKGNFTISIDGSEIKSKFEDLTFEVSGVFLGLGDGVDAHMTAENVQSIAWKEDPPGPGRLTVTNASGTATIGFEDTDSQIWFEIGMATLTGLIAVLGGAGSIATYVLANTARAAELADAAVSVSRGASDAADISAAGWRGFGVGSYLGELDDAEMMEYFCEDAESPSEAGDAVSSSSGETYVPATATAGASTAGATAAAVAPAASTMTSSLKTLITVGGLAGVAGALVSAGVAIDLAIGKSERSKYSAAKLAECKELQDLLTKDVQWTGAESSYALFRLDLSDGFRFSYKWNG
jgi:hypothetical protein